MLYFVYTYTQEYISYITLTTAIRRTDSVHTDTGTPYYRTFFRMRRRRCCVKYNRPPAAPLHVLLPLHQSVHAHHSSLTNSNQKFILPHPRNGVTSSYLRRYYYSNSLLPTCTRLSSQPTHGTQAEHTRSPVQFHRQPVEVARRQT